MSSPSHPAHPTRLTLEEALSSAGETKVLKLAEGCLSEIPALFRDQFPNRRGWVISDEHLAPVAARAVHRLLAAADLAAAPPLLLPADVYAEHAFVEQLETALRQHDVVPVAVGSGTINDLVKLAAHAVGRPYLCVATAASMDGYTAFGASITFRGAKQTFQCPAPRAVIADLAILRKAPSDMTAAGYADLLAKITAGADWLVADALGHEAIDQRAWTIVQGGLRQALADPDGARHGDVGAIHALTEGLMLGGFAMQWAKSSRPASGAEHQFSHLWDMEHHVHRGQAPSHGFKVGIGSLAVTALYEELLRQPLEQIDVERCCAAWPTAPAMEQKVRELFAADSFLETALIETRAKHPSREDLARELQQLRDRWPELRRALQSQLMPFPEMRDRLRRVGAPTQPAEIGLTPERVRRSFRRAYHIRRRYTVLDLAARTQVLDSCLERVWGPQGPWGRP